MTSTITLITGEGSVRVYGDNLVLDLRSQTATEYGHVESSVSHASSAVEFGATNSNRQGGNGPLIPILSATEEQHACGNGSDPFEKPADIPRQQVDRAAEAPASQASAAILHRHTNINSGATLCAASGSDGHLSEKKLVVNRSNQPNKRCQNPASCKWSVGVVSCSRCAHAPIADEVAA
jgi:hypothetical protein